jgi:hypothetical protein
MALVYFEKVRDQLSELEIDVTEENAEAALFVVEDEDRGIKNLIIDCEDELLVIEQVIFEITGDEASVFKRLLQMNRELVHGAFVLDEEGKIVLFRDTLQLANLDLNELEASINALGLGLAMFADELIGFAKPA